VRAEHSVTAVSLSEEVSTFLPQLHPHLLSIYLYLFIYLFLCLFDNNCSSFYSKQESQGLNLKPGQYLGMCHVFKNFLHVVAFIRSEADLVVSLTVYDVEEWVVAGNYS
jgi:hypothetical protein